MIKQLFFLCFLMGVPSYTLACALHNNTVQEVQLAPASTAWLIEKHTHPIIVMQFAFARSGFAYDPRGKEGLAVLVASLLNEGAGEYSASAFKNALETLGISLHFDVDEDYFYITVRSLSENKEQAVRLASLALTQPHLANVSIGQMKRQIVAQIAKQDEYPAIVAEKTWAKTMFSPHPYAHSREGSRASITAISRTDVLHYLAAHFSRHNMTISVVGDITPGQLRGLFTSYFNKLPAASESIPALGDFTLPAHGSLVIVDKAVPQATVVFGSRGIKRRDPDFYAAYVLNQILAGGGLDSRLMRKVRKERGLVYSVYSYFNTYENSGVFKGGFATKNSTMREAVAVIKAEIDRIRTEGVTTEELSDAKNYLILSFPIKLDKAASLAQVLTTMQLDGLGADYLAKRDQYIRAVSLADINRVAKRLFDPEKMVIVVTGNKQEIR